MESINFWQDLNRPIVGLSPMDGVTDLPFRVNQARVAKPDVIFTEFIPVEGIVRLNQKLLRDFWYLAEERPVVAQIYGNDPELFYSAAQLVAELGFDGVDLNMGCPAKSVVHRGCGAALINTPDLAKQLIKATYEGVKSWRENGGIEWDKWPEIKSDKARTEFEKFINTSQNLGIYKDFQLINEGDDLKLELGKNNEASKRDRVRIPVSVKSRIGFRESVVERWVDELLDSNAEVISLHGRTLKQMYRGQADWEEIAKAVNRRDKSGKDTLILGNGDITSREDLRKRVDQTNVDGVLIGRGTFGNPWIFDDVLGNVSKNEHEIDKRFNTMIEHAKLHEFYKEESEFVQMRKNLAWYISHVPGAAKLRSKLVRSNSARELEEIITEYLN